MRHHKHKNQLGVKKEHRLALMSNLSAALIREGRIQTTLKKAKALRPFAERLITLAKKGGLANRRLAMARVRDTAAIQTLFNERVGEFTNRPGGYTRIYKLGTQRRGDAAEMAIIEFVPADDPGYKSTKRRPKAKKAEAGAVAAAVEGDEAAPKTEEAAEAAPASDQASEAKAETVATESDATESEAEAKVEPEAQKPDADEEKKADDK